MNIAVVEDEAGVREAVVLALQDTGYTVSAFPDGSAAWEAWQEQLPHLVILDIVMPRMDGLELCRKLRSRSLETPVIFLSSKDEEIDRVVGLELGADDYLCKPFSVRELVARVRALERRLRLAASSGSGNSGEERRGVIFRGPLSLDSDALRANWQQQPVGLTVTEFRIVEALVRHPGAVLSREQLLAAAYPDDVYVTERSIDSHIRRIRRKFEAANGGTDILESVYGAGYRYREPVASE